MRGHIIVEDRFLHLGIDHHLFVTASDGAEHEYRFEVRRIAPGADHPETIYEKTENLAAWLERAPTTSAGELLCEEITLIKAKIMDEEDEIHAHDP